ISALAGHPGSPTIAAREILTPLPRLGTSVNDPTGLGAAKGRRTVRPRPARPRHPAGRRRLAAARRTLGPDGGAASRREVLTAHTARFAASSPSRDRHLVVR